MVRVHVFSALLSAFLCASVISNTSFALTGRDCVGESVKITKMQLFDAPNKKAVAVWDITKGKVTYKDAAGKSVTVPLQCSPDRKFLIPVEVAQKVVNGNFNLQVDVGSVNSTAKRWYGTGLRNLAIRFTLGETVNGVYKDLFSHFEQGKPFDMCGSKSESGGMISCSQHGLKGDKLYELQIRACSLATVNGPASELSCRAGDIMFQGLLDLTLNRS